MDQQYPIFMGTQVKRLLLFFGLLSVLIQYYEDNKSFLERGMMCSGTKLARQTDE